MGERVEVVLSEQVEGIIEIARGQEELRQERETFNQRKNQDSRWFLLRLAMGWIAAIVLPAIMILCSWVILYHHEFDTATVTVATTALLVDTLGIVLSVWRIVVGPGTQSLGPVTTSADRPPSRGRRAK